MLIASCMGGIGINCAIAGAVHATAHALGGRFSIPHGLANSIMLPWVMEANLETCLDRYRDIARAMGERVDGLAPKEAARLAIEGVQKLKGAIHLTETLADFGLTEKKIDEVGLVDLAMADATFSYNPKELQFDEVREVYRKAL